MVTMAMGATAHGCTDAPVGLNETQRANLFHFKWLSTYNKDHAAQQMTCGGLHAWQVLWKSICIWCHAAKYYIQIIAHTCCQRSFLYDGESRCWRQPNKLLKVPKCLSLSICKQPAMTHCSGVKVSWLSDRENKVLSQGEKSVRKC